MLTKHIKSFLIMSIFTIHTNYSSETKLAKINPRIYPALYLNKANSKHFNNKIPRDIIKIILNFYYPDGGFVLFWQGTKRNGYYDPIYKPLFLTFKNVERLKNYKKTMESENKPMKTKRLQKMKKGFLKANNLQQ